MKTELLPERIGEEITKDIFDYQIGTVYVNVKGIRDAENPTDLHLLLLALREKWDGPQKYPQVYEWIVKNEATTMKESMIAPVQVSAGLPQSTSPTEMNA